MENEKNITMGTETLETKKRGRPKKEKSGEASHEYISQLETKIALLEKQQAASCLDKTQEQIQTNNLNSEAILSMDPSYQRKLQSEELKKWKAKNRIDEEWIEEIRGKKVKVTQIYFKLPDGTLEKGNRWRKYLGKVSKTGEKSYKTEILKTIENKRVVR